MLLAAQHNPLAASTVIVSGRGRLLGYSLRESAGSPAPAAVPFYDGISNAAPLFHNVVLAASGVANAWFGPQGIQFRSGLFVGALTGALAGTLYFVTEEAMSPNLGVQSNSLDDKLFERFSLADFVRFLEYLR